MWWCLPIVAALLFADGSESYMMSIREMSSKPLVEMTDSDTRHLSTYILDVYENSKLACPERARSTFTFGMMTPRILANAPRIRQMVFHTMKKTVPIEVQSKVSNVIVDAVLDTIRQTENVPELIHVFEGIGKLNYELDTLVDEIINTPGSMAPRLTGRELVRRIRTMIESLNVKCEKLITQEQLRKFITGVESIMQDENAVKAHIKTITTSIKALIPDNLLAEKVANGAIKTMRVVLADIRTNIRNMALPVPAKIPIGIFIRNIVKISHPVEDMTFEAPVDTVLRFVYMKPSEQHETGIKFPAETDRCYEQKFIAYNIALLRIFSNMRMKTVSAFMPYTIDQGIRKPLYEVLETGLVEDLMNEELLANKGVQLALKSSRKFQRDLSEMEKEGALTEETIANAVSHMLAKLKGKICRLEPTLILPVLTKCFDKIERSFNENLVQLLRERMSTEVDQTLLNEMHAKIAPIVEEFKPAFEAIYREFKSRTISPKPIFAIRSLISNLKTVYPVTTVVADLSIADALRMHGLNGNDVITSVSLPKLRLVIEKLFGELEASVPKACTRRVEMKFTEALMKLMIISKFHSTEHTVMYMLERAIKPKNANLFDILRPVKWFMQQELYQILKEVSKIGENAKDSKMAYMLNEVDIAKMPTSEMLQRMMGIVSEVMQEEVARCEKGKEERINQHELLAGYINKLANRWTSLSQPKHLESVLAKIFGDDKESAERAREIMMNSLTTFSNEMTSIVSPLAKVTDFNMVRKLFIDNLMITLQKRSVPLSEQIYSVKSVDAMELFRNTVFKRISTVYKKILTKQLEGATTQRLTADEVGQLVDDIVKSLLGSKTGMVINPRKGFQLSADEVNIGHLLDLFEGVDTEALPSDVIRETIIRMVQHIDQTVPEKCQVPIKIKLIAAYIRLHLEQLINTPPNHPVHHMLMPILQAMNPMQPISMKTIMTAVVKLLPELRTSSIKAMQNLEIFKNTDSMLHLLSEVVSEVEPTETTPERYSAILPRLNALLEEATMCEMISPKTLQAEGAIFMQRMFKSSFLNRETLNRILRSELPNDYERKEVIEAIFKVALPLFEQRFSRFLQKSTHAASDEAAFPVFYSHVIVESLGLTTPPMERLLTSPAYENFIYEIKNDLIARLLPVSKLPAEKLDERLEDAYMKTLHVLGLMQ